MTYLTVLSRERSLGAIDKAMKRIAARLERDIAGVRITTNVEDRAVIRLHVQERRTQIKIEVTPVMRGCAYEPQMRSVCAQIEDMFGFAEMQVVSFPDLYAGKILAALDRQHPRDLFDVRDLLANEGITDELREAFLVYLMSHRRPMAELLSSPQKDIAQVFANNFVGMTEEPVTLDELIAARAAMVAEVVGKMPQHHRIFLVDFEAGSPDWSMLKVAYAGKLPAVKWRQLNFNRLPRNDRIENVRRLADTLGVKAKPAQLSLLAEPKPTQKPRGKRAVAAGPAGKTGKRSRR